MTIQGAIPLARLGLAELLSASPAFQALFGAADATAARARITWPYADFAGGQALPVAVISNVEYQTERLGDEQGELGVTLYSAIPEEFVALSHADFENFEDSVLTIIKEIKGLSRTINPATGEHFFHLTEVCMRGDVGWLKADETGIEDCRVGTFLVKWV